MIDIISLLLNILIAYFSLINVLFFSIGKKYKIAVFLYIVMCLSFVAPFIGQLTSTLILFGCLLLIAFSSEKKLYTLSSSAASYMIIVTVNHFILSFLSTFGIGATQLYDNKYYLLIFNLLFSILTYIITYLLRRPFSMIEVKFENVQKKESLFTAFLLLISATIFIVNFIMAEQEGYPKKIMIVNTLTYLLYIVLIFSSVYVYTKKTKNEERLHAELKQYDSLIQYTKEIESLYNEMRVFKHDYINILSTLSGYIEKSNQEDLKKYFYKNILSYSKSLTDMDMRLGDLAKIDDLNLKSLYSSKLYLAITKKITVHINIINQLQLDNLHIDKVDLFRILGIFLDNAIEASEESEDKQLEIGIQVSDKNTIFLVQNTYKGTGLNIARLKERGYSTKEANMGLGLFTANDLLDKYKHISLSTSARNNRFAQELSIPCNAIS